MLCLFLSYAAYSVLFQTDFLLNPQMGLAHFISGWQILSTLNASVANTTERPRHQPFTWIGATWHQGGVNTTAVAPYKTPRWMRVWEMVATPSHAAVAIMTMVVLITALLCAWRCAVFWHAFGTPSFWARYPACCLQTFNTIKWRWNRYRNWVNRTFLEPCGVMFPIHCR